MKICFMGTPLFASIVLKNLLSKHSIAAVYTKPPAAKKRGLKVLISKVHEVALANNIPVFYPQSFKDAAAIKNFVAQKFDLAIVVAYGLILPTEIFSSPKYGTINLHASLLPKWRGAAPIERSLEAGDLKTGVTIMHIAKELDSGDIILQEEFALTSTTTASTVYSEMAKVGTKLLLQVIALLNNGQTLPRKKQAHNLASYAKMLQKSEGKVNFNQPASTIIRKINAFEIFPGSYFYYNNEFFKIIKASIITYAQLQHLLVEKNLTSKEPLFTKSFAPQPGLVISTPDSLYIATSDHFINIEVLQRAGKKALAIEELLKGYSFDSGSYIN